jgi:hypothetical protein
VERIDTSLGKFDGLGVQVASAVDYSKSNLRKMDGLQIQLAKGIDYSKSNFGLISAGVDRLQDSLVQARTGVDELVSSYSGIDPMPIFSIFKDFGLLYWPPDESLQKAYDWLSPLAGEFEKKQLDTLDLKCRQDGLGHWLLETTEFKKWMNGIGETLWCCGERMTALYSALLYILMKPAD